MKTILFRGELTADSADELISLSTIASNAGVAELRLIIDSSGYDFFNAYRIYKHMKSLPMMIHAHNSNNIYNFSNLLFLSGTVRTATPDARFAFKPLELNLNEGTTYSHSNLRGMVNKMDDDFQKMIELYSLATQNHADVDWNSLLSHYTSISSNRALGLGYIDIIYDCKISNDQVLGVVG
ncbi:ATP-dependent Clp protease proteolytic subunit [Enterobacter ludwigii]